MFGATDLAGLASVLLAVSAILGALNAILSTLIRRQAKENNRVAVQNYEVLAQVSHDLNDSNRRVEGTYQQMIEESKALLAYIQGLNTPAPPR